MKIIDIKLTYECNNNCFLCCQDSSIKNSLGTLSTNKIIDILEDNHNRFINIGENVKLVLTGGEPTIHKGLEEIIECAHNLGYRPIQLQTNATKLYDSLLVKRIIKLGVDSFGISLHGHTSEIHEKFTRTKGSFQKTIQALKELKKYDIKVAINVVISKLNIGFLDDIVKFICENNLAQDVQLAFIHITGRAANASQFVPKISTASKKIKECVEIGKKHNINVTSEAIPYCLLRGYEKKVSELYFNDDIIVFDKQGEIHFSKYRKNDFKSKCEECKKCIFYNICEGPWKEYPELYGWDEFVPIKEF